MLRRWERSLVLAIAASACGPRPVEVVNTALRSIERGDIERLGATIADDYSDALGRKSDLLFDAHDLLETFGRIRIEASDVSTTSLASKLEAEVVGRLDFEGAGEVAVRSTGPLEMVLRRQGDFRIRSGLLTDIRDVRSLMDTRRRALEANDAEAYGRLLHPTYKDGDHDIEDTKARIRADLSAVRVRLQPSLYKIEFRGPYAHVDEHYVLTVNDRALPPAIARLTLARAGARWRIASGLYPK